MNQLWPHYVLIVPHTFFLSKIQFEFERRTDHRTTVDNRFLERERESMYVHGMFRGSFDFTITKRNIKGKIINLKK